MPCDAYLNAADLCAVAGWTVGGPLPDGIPARQKELIAADPEGFADRVTDALEARVAELLQDGEVGAAQDLARTLGWGESEIQALPMTS